MDRLPKYAGDYYAILDQGESLLLRFENKSGKLEAAVNGFGLATPEEVVDKYGVIDWMAIPPYAKLGKILQSMDNLKMAGYLNLK